MNLNKKLVIVFVATCILAALITLNQQGDALANGKTEIIFKRAARSILKCLHPTGQYSRSYALGAFRDGDQYYIKGKIIWYGGFFDTPYQTVVGMRIRHDSQAKIEVLEDTAFIKGGEHCGLFSWTPLSRFGQAAKDAASGLFADSVKTGVDVMEEVERIEKENRRKFCNSINWPDRAGECGILAGQVNAAFFKGKPWTKRAEGYVNRVFQDGSLEFKITEILRKGEEVAGLYEGKTLSVPFLYPCLPESELEKIYRQCL